ncbi:hypothetical protein DSO57_1026847 [Entomophthora muscae]|uniref:Uncharacterized protein n=2 Tax=Entomophthora muscae TaxID=34485 RepID=A0ACC2RSV0_9FUNG|nr:hypothetical protein DSO57_1026845 [Entomophthora muscae]KAJ9053176.1 hypothetical protein DSO57_1026847 [Entomophthora muscae]
MVLALVSGENLVKLDPSSTERPLKVLVSMTFGSRSHIKNIFEIGKTLQKRGHKLSYMAIEPYLRFADGYNVTRHQLGPSGIEVDDHRGISELNQVPVNPLLDTLDALIEHLPIIYRMTLKDVLDVIDLEKPDVMICDFFSPSCIDGAHQRKIPLITGLQTLDGPILPPTYVTGVLSYFPTTIKGLNFFQRFYSTAMYPLMALPRYITLNTKINAERALFGIAPTTVVNVGNWDNSLKICNTFVGFEAARPLEPTMKLVGPIMSDEFSPLTQHLSSFLNTKQRVMYIAFGSGVVLSKKDVQILFSAVTQLVEEDKADGIVWALGKTPHATFEASQVSTQVDGKTLHAEELLNNQHPKIQFASWAPQVAILSHPAVRVFLSHGGLESIFEGIYAGTPILAMPFFSDQHRNGRKVVEMGFGGYSDRLTQTASSLHKVMSDMMLDADGKLANSILHWKVIARMNAKRKEEAANLVEEFALTNKVCRLAPGADPNAPFSCGLDHLVPGYHKMNVLLAYGIDVFSFLGLLIFLGSLPGFFLLRSLSRYAFKSNDCSTKQKIL